MKHLRSFLNLKKVEVPVIVMNLSGVNEKKFCGHGSGRGSNMRKVAK